MVVGKTSSSISKSEIFSKVSETQVLTSVFPNINTLPCLICSPLRGDRNPSFSIYVNSSGHVRYKDFADSNENGGLLDLLCKYWGCTFNQALDKINDLFIEDSNVEIKPKNIKTLSFKENTAKSKIQVVVRPWRDYDYSYWESYGISRKWLHYADIHPISHKIVTVEGKRHIFPADRYAYCWVNKKDGNLSIKIYQPYNTKGFKWCSKANKSVIDLWTKIPEYGEKVIIASSMKDALCLSCNLHIPAISLQGEGYSMSDTAIKELKRRYKRIFISFDTDAPGKKDAAKLAESTGFINITPNLIDCKDYSDAYKAYGKEWFIKTIKPLFE